jgi:hypothetical protein
MATSHRPLTLGEILDRTVQLYRRNFLQFAGISSLPAALMVLLTGGAGAYASSQVNSLKGDTQGMVSFILIVTAMILVGLPLMIGAFTLTLSASNYAALRGSRGEAVTIRASYGFAFRHFWRHLLLLFLQVLLAGILPYLVFAGVMVVGVVLGAVVSKSGAGTVLIPLFVVLLVVLALAMFVVCVLVWLRYSLSFAASTAEELPAWRSMQRSASLSKDSRGRIFVMFLLVYALSVAVSLALMIPLMIAITFAMQKQMAGSQPPPAFLVAVETANFGVSFLVRAFVMPVYSIALMLFYFDQRTRQEGYDIELLMAQAGWNALPAAGWNVPPTVMAAEVAVSQPAVETPAADGAQGGEQPALETAPERAEP